MKMEMERDRKYRRRRAPRLIRRLAAIAALALAIALADVLSPFIKNWMYQVLPHLNYHSAAEQLTHEMEKAGELIAVRHTDTGVMTGSVAGTAVGSGLPPQADSSVITRPSNIIHANDLFILPFQFP